MFENCLLFNVRNMEQKLTKMADESFSHINLHPTYGYIITLIGTYEFTKVKIIAEELNLDSSTITRMINKLINMGYVKKGSDKSKVDLSLTIEGQELLKEVVKCWDDFHAKYKEVLSQAELTRLETEITNFNEKIKIDC